MPSEYERFRQQIFDQRDDLKDAEEQHVSNDFVEKAVRSGIDISSELRKGTPMDEIIKRVLSIQHPAAW